MIALDHGWPTGKMQAKRRGGEKTAPQKLSSNSSCGCCSLFDQRLLYIPKCRHNNHQQSTWHGKQIKTKHNKLKQINAQTQTNALISLTGTITFWLTNCHQLTNEQTNHPTNRPNLDARPTKLRDLHCIESEFQPATAHLESLFFAQGDGWYFCCCFSMLFVIDVVVDVVDDVDDVVLVVVLVVVVVGGGGGGGGWWVVVLLKVHNHHDDSHRTCYPCHCQDHPLAITIHSTLWYIVI